MHETESDIKKTLLTDSEELTQPKNIREILKGKSPKAQLAMLKSYEKFHNNQDQFFNGLTQAWCMGYITCQERYEEAERAILFGEGESQALGILNAYVDDEGNTGLR